MGDEGVGVHVVRQLQTLPLPPGVDCEDGGTGSLNLLEPMQQAQRVILVDATVDGAPAGTIVRLQPRFSSDYPRTLTAHDIGLKDLLDTLYLLGEPPPVRLFAVSIAPLGEPSLELSPEIAAVVPQIVAAVLDEAARE